jgi:hypothetical protein
MDPVLSSDARQAKVDSAFFRGHVVALLEQIQKNHSECRADRVTAEGELFGRQGDIEKALEYQRGKNNGAKETATATAATAVREPVLSSLDWAAVAKIALVMVALGVAVGSGLGMYHYASRNGTIPPTAAAEK